jgi:hypothetical protein
MEGEEEREFDLVMVGDEMNAWPGLRCLSLDMACRAPPTVSTVVLQSTGGQPS